MNLDRSYRDTFARRRRRRILAAATILMAALLAIDISTGGILRAPLRAMLVRVSSGMNAIGIRIGESGYFASKRSLARENARLEAEIAQLNERDAARDSLERENEMLRALTRVVGSGAGISAPVRSSLGASPYGTFLVGVGRAEGVSEGNIVLTGAGFVVGTVAEVHEHTAAIAMLFAPGITIEALVGDIPAAVEGQGGGNARAQIPRAAIVTEGMTVSAPGYGGRHIGVVGKIDSDAARSEQTAYISLPINLSSLMFVYIAPL
ncbi:MAG TPA: rod shape-determining protein MreC [Candidatus Paceibacterota bacterium]